MALIFVAVYFAIRMMESAEVALDREYNRSENLLLSLMPTSIALRLKNQPSEIIADHFDEVTILFVDIVDFTPRASQLPPRDITAATGGNPRPLAQVKSSSARTGRRGPR